MGSFGRRDNFGKGLLKAADRSAVSGRPAVHLPHRLGRFFGPLCAVLTILFTLVSPAWSYIENQAFCDGNVDGSSFVTTTASNVVRVQLQFPESFTLTADRQVQASAGSQVILNHTLTNTGNAPSDYTIILANLNGDGYDIENLTLYRNIGNTGTLSPTDPVIPPGGTITLNPGESAVLIVTGVVPASVSSGLAAGIRLSAVTSQGGSATNTDSITTLAAAVIQLTKTASNLTPQPGDEVAFTVSGVNSGSDRATGIGPADGSQLTVDGNSAQLVLVRDVVPANTSYLPGSLNCSAGATPLFHRNGDPPFAYFQAEPPLVDETACGVALLDAGQLITLAFTARINANASGKIVNTARGFYHDSPVLQSATASSKSVDSNRIELTLPDRAPTIGFYTDTTYSRVATASPLSDPLLVQANASQCNADPLAAETKTVTITSALTGDVEAFSGVETGPNTGFFRILPNVPTRDGGMNQVIQGNGIVEEQKNDQLTAVIAGCGSASATATVLIDPYGIVFNSRTGLPLDGAVVTLIDSATGQPAPVFGDDAASSFPSTVTTGSVTTDSGGRLYDFPPGGFRFPLVQPGTYELRVTPPNGYTFPSNVAAGLLPPGRAIDPAGSYGRPFQVNDTVRIDLPVDTAPVSGLFAEKSSSVKMAEPGDFVDYTVKVNNRTGKVLSQITLNDTLPAGFSYLQGSARLGNAPINDPEGGHGPRLAFALGDLADDDLVTLTYRVRIGPGAFEGDGINHAQASDPSGARSNVASARVKLQGGVFSDKGFIIGKFFTDCNRNRLQDEEELGIPGVRLYLEDGTYVITDSEGKFSLYNISPRTHVLKIDDTTLPAGAELIDLSNRNAGDAGSRFIDLKSGELHKANFAEGSCNDLVMKQVKARRAKGEVFVAESERSLAKPLVFQTADSTGNVRGLPASGIIGGENNLPPYPTVQEETPAAKPGDADRAAISKAALSLEALLPEMDNELGFISPKDGDVLLVSQTAVRLKGPTGGELKLFVNGNEISAKSVGQKTTSRSRQLEVKEYIAIDLKPGENDLELVLLGPFGNRRGESKIRVTAPGKPAKIVISVPDGEFSADGRTPLPVTVRLLDEKGIPVNSRTPLTLESSLGRWSVTDLNEKEQGTQVVLEGSGGEYLLTPPSEPGETLVKVSSGSFSDEKKVFFVPALRPLIATGLVEGIINLRSLGGNPLVPARAQDGFERELRAYSFSGNDGKTTGAARAALFLKGKVKGEYLLTVAYDSDKDTRESLFRDIQPDQFYPVYGDSAIKGYDAQSTGRLYVRIDKNKSYLLYGDFTTPQGGEARSLGAYNRSLNGLKWHYEDRHLSANAFASEDTGTQVIDEIPARGISGPYFLTRSGFITNSEKVEIITRDRNQPSLIITTVPQTRFTDYEVEELTGRILFKAPVATLDANLNPNFIRVTYEVDQGGESYWVAGVDGRAKLHERVEVGGSYVRDENPQEKADLKSANMTVKLAEKTYLIGEWAESFKESVGTGDAGRVELRHDGEKLQGRIYAARTGAAFVNQAASIGSGRLETGGKVTYRLNPATVILGEALHSEDVVSGGTKDGIMVNIQRSLTNFLKAEFGLRHAHETATPSQPGGQADTPIDFTSLRARLGGQIPTFPKLGLYGEYEQALSHGDRRMAAAGGEYQFAEKSRLYFRHEFITSLAGPYALNGSQQQNATVVGVDSAYIKDGRAFSEYRLRDAVAGRDAEAAIGLRNAWSVAKGLRINTTLERIQTLGGKTDNTATAVTGAVEYTASPLWKGTARMEVRVGTTSNSYLNTLGIAWKLNRNVTLLGKQIFSYADNTGDTDKVQERLQAGFAYRPTDTDTWNVLARYEFKLESDESQPGLPASRTVNIVSAHLNYQPAKPLTLTAHYAGKLVVEDSNGLSGTSNTHLISGRTIYDLTSKWDVGVNYSALFSDFFKSTRYGLGGEAGYLVAANLWLSTGYNFYGFSDRDLSAEEYTAQGVYLRLRFKFDENLFSWNDPKANKTLPAKPVDRSGS